MPTYPALLQLVLFVLSFFSLSARAELISTCEFSGKLVLQQDAQIYCDGDLRFAPQSKIVTLGHDLTIVAYGNLLLSEPGDDVGVVIQAFEDRSIGRSSGSILVFALTPIGKWTIDNQAATVDDTSGKVSFEFVALVKANYEQEVLGNDGIQVSMILDGKRVALQAPAYKL